VKALGGSGSVKAAFLKTSSAIGLTVSDMRQQPVKRTTGKISIAMVKLFRLMAINGSSWCSDFISYHNPFRKIFQVLPRKPNSAFGKPHFFFDAPERKFYSF
jgi:hypothetical protein